MRTGLTSTAVTVIGAGQAGLAAGYHLQRHGIDFQILEATDRAAGSWPLYYDSLELFSPARFSALPGLPFGGDPGRYPLRDEVVEYLTGYARHFKFPIRYGTRVTRVEKRGEGFAVSFGDQTLLTRAVVVATGSFSSPNLPSIDGAAAFQGAHLHALDYRHPSAFAGKRVIVVGAGNTAVQIAAELAEVASVTLATREPVRFLPKKVLGLDIHWWFYLTKIERTRLFSDQGTPVICDGRYRRALRAERPRRRPMFRAFHEKGVIWSDGAHEDVDAVIFGTGYRSTAPYLAPLGALDERGLIMQRRGISTHDPCLCYVGFSQQRNFASATLRGAGGDAKHVVRHLLSQLRRPG